MKKFLSKGAILIATTTFVSVPSVSTVFAQTNYEKVQLQNESVDIHNSDLENVIQKMPSEQQKLIKKAITCAQENQTDNFLTSQDGQALTNYFKENPELYVESIKNTEAKAVPKRNGLINVTNLIR